MLIRTIGVFITFKYAGSFLFLVTLLMDNAEWYVDWFNSPYYHLLYNNRNYNEANFFIDNLCHALQLKPHSKIWDLACGRGRHAIALNNKGFDVTGTDLSENSIKEASLSGNETLEFFVHDMRKSFKSDYFDSVFNLFTSLGYFKNYDDNFCVFKNVANALKPNGVFVIDFFNSEKVTASFKSQYIERRGDITFDIKKKIIDKSILKHIEFSNEGKNYYFEESVTLFKKSDFEEFARCAGLKLDKSFGNYQLDTFDEKNSERLILIFKNKFVNPIIAIACLIAPILLAGLLAFNISIQQSRLRLILAFSAAYLFAISIMHMLPEAFMNGEVKLVGLFIVLGFCLQLVIDTFSTGIEHGHVHLHSHSCQKHLPYGIIIGLVLHSFLEGLPIYDLNSPQSSNINYQLILGLAIHNLPITIAFVSLLKEHQGQKVKNWLLLFLFAIMTPLGYLSSYVLQSFGLHNYEVYSQAAFALVIGIFLHISTAILFETSDHHKYNIAKVAVMACGIILAYFIS